MSDDDGFEASTPYGRYRQTEVFTTGMLTGETPDVPVAYEDLKAAAEAAMDEDAYGYVAGSAGGESTTRANRDAFDDHRLVPRVLRDTGERDLSVEVLGETWPVPVALAPIGVQGVLHDDGDLASARAAAAEDVSYVTSTQSSYPLEDVAAELEGSDAPNWFQLYWSKDRDVTASLVDRAEAAGYDAICLTLDTPHLGWRERDVQNGYLPFLDGKGIANYTSDPAFRDRLDADPEENPRETAREFVDVFADPTLSFADLDWLFDRTDLPVVCKGVLHPDDARRCVDAGADGVVVSNHGGRQVDRAVAALDQLPAIADAVADADPEAAILFDSGIRRGADAVVALALGADAVLLGRPYCYGLALDGEEGVRAVLSNFLADLDLSVALTGRDSIRGVDADAVTSTDP
ncbi:alpha-hydroxy-acid oxidizing protein [Halorubellus sp. JP-L1]|uniref:alpha-hydroxy-acid oxidizing protein n=1 Tax=Halorubellus sp. JP-L1 TaxID=2715753 RepID=UPI001408B68A|nr:alpha-hydroxy-acid oxidizing protein [Halorubellus sp. JP-L1]NHN43264.1 alpha-hydroxy-acid oxidizing protein [Halorubellus sp. JP-L1]